MSRLCGNPGRRRVTALRCGSDLLFVGSAITAIILQIQAPTAVNDEGSIDNLLGLICGVTAFIFLLISCVIRSSDHGAEEEGALLPTARVPGSR